MTTVKNSSNTSGGSTNAILLDSNLFAELDSIALRKNIAPEGLFHRMIEQVLVSPTRSEDFIDFLGDAWWHVNAAGPVQVLHVGNLTSTLLTYLAYSTGFEWKTDQAAEHLISFYAGSGRRATIH